MRSSCNAAAFLVVANGDTNSVDATFRPRFWSAAFSSDDTVGFASPSHESRALHEPDR
jgi:hypothetical protein